MSAASQSQIFQLLLLFTIYVSLAVSRKNRLCNLNIISFVNYLCRQNWHWQSLALLPCTLSHSYRNKLLLFWSHFNHNYFCNSPFPLRNQKYLFKILSEHWLNYQEGVASKHCVMSLCSGHWCEDWVNISWCSCTCTDTGLTREQRRHYGCALFLHSLNFTSSSWSAGKRGNFPCVLWLQLAGILWGANYCHLFA